jgi:predicted nucleotidyltransferase
MRKSFVAKFNEIIKGGVALKERATDADQIEILVEWNEKENFDVTGFEIDLYEAFGRKQVDVDTYGTDGEMCTYIKIDKDNFKEFNEIYRKYKSTRG